MTRYEYRNGIQYEVPHRHRAVPSKAKDWGFGHCVAHVGYRHLANVAYRVVGGTRCEPGSHGNITRLDYCRCGAERASNLNGRWVERGPWIDEEGVAS